MSTATLPDTFRVIRTEDDPHLTKLMKRVVESARRSPDPSTQNGAVLAQRTGEFFAPIPQTWAVNEFPRDVAYTDERWERPLKYSIIEHAERNSIYQAAANGIRTRGLSLVCPWAACSDCARAIIQAGVETLVTLLPKVETTHARWDASIDIAMTMLAEAKVSVIYLEGQLGCEYPLRRNGQEIYF